MPRYNYDSIKKYIYEKSNGECELLSTEYINSKTPLLLKCKCGNVFKRTFNKLKNSQFVCLDCIHNQFSKNYSLDFGEVLQIIKNGNCEYISGEYENYNSKLILKCKCGNTFVKDIAHFKKGQNVCLECAKKKLSNSKLKYNLEKVKQILSEKGYILKEEKYINSVTPMKCLCKRGHNVEIKLTYFLKNSSGCRLCAILDSKGSNHWNYKGGESEVIDMLRKLLKEWKREVLKRDGFKCVISNKKQNLQVHHLKNFLTIVEETFSELNLPLHRKLKYYTDLELNNITDLFLKKHTLDIGITINKDIHKKFHKLYGNKNNTIEQFEEFKSTENINIFPCDSVDL